MGPTAVDEILARRFRIDRPPTLVARKSVSPRSHVAFSRMRSDHPMRGRSMAVPAESAYSFHVPMTTPFFSDLWMDGKRKTLPDANLGDAFLFDLSENPKVGLDTSFNSMRFYVPKAALDEDIQNKRGFRDIEAHRVKGRIEADSRVLAQVEQKCVAQIRTRQSFTFPIHPKVGEERRGHWNVK